ncbi:MAG: hypothetical protein IPO63_02520 [Bacteroidetes bacterium]|nr:hypothetical protein [Bacteroidota bacterium]
MSIARQGNAKTNAHAYEKIDDVVSVLLRSVGFYEEQASSPDSYREGE